MPVQTVVIYADGRLFADNFVLFRCRTPLNPLQENTFSARV